MFIHLLSVGKGIQVGTSSQFLIFKDALLLIKVKARLLKPEKF